MSERCPCYPDADDHDYSCPLRAEPPAELPEGVHQAPSGDLLAKGGHTPDGWERSLVPGKDEWSSAPADGPLAGFWYEVRPIPKPETKWVPLHKLIGCTLPGEDRPITEFSVHDHDGPGFDVHTYCGHIVNVVATADGTVEVLAR